MSQRKPSRLSSGWLTVVSLVALFCIWQLVSLVAGSSEGGQHNVPSIVDLANSLKNLGYYWQGGLGVRSTETGAPLTWSAAGLALVYNTGLTLLRMFAGLALGIVVGIVVAVAISWSSLLRRIFSLPAHIARMLPMLALLPLFALWFGSSFQGAVFFVGFSTFAVMFALTLTAIDEVPAHFANSARSLGASRLRTYLSVVVPSILPRLRPALLLSLGFAWSAVIGAELLGEQHGLGQISQLAQFYGRTNILGVVAAIVVICAGVSYAIAKRGLSYLTRWAE